MAALNGLIKDSRYDLLQVSNNNTGVDGTLRNISSGAGNNVAMQLSTAGVKFTGTVAYGSYSLAFGGNFSTGGTFSTSSTFAVTGALSIGSAFTTAGTFSTGGNFSTSSTVSITGTFSTDAAVTHSGSFAATHVYTGVTNATYPTGTYTLVKASTDISSAGIVTKTNNVSFAASATTDTTVASNISSGTLPAGRMPALTGDITTSAGAVATTLATVNSNVGTFGGASTPVSITTNAKGLVTAVSSQNAVTSILTFSTGNSGGPGAGATVYLGIAGIGHSATELNVVAAMPFACTVSKMYVVASTGASGVQTFTYTLRKAQADTTITCSSTSTATTASDTTHSVSFAAGDLIDVKLVTSASAATANHMIMLQVVSS